jgi:hypothetical protein
MSKFSGVPYNTLLTTEVTLHAEVRIPSLRTSITEVFVLETSQLLVLRNAPGPAKKRKQFSRPPSRICTNHSKQSLVNIVIRFCEQHVFSRCQPHALVPLLDGNAGI